MVLGTHQISFRLSQPFFHNTYLLPTDRQNDDGTHPVRQGHLSCRPTWPNDDDDKTVINRHNVNGSEVVENGSMPQCP